MPLTVIRTRTAAAIGTTITGWSPKYSPARLTPMNSVLIVRKFSKKIPPAENHPQLRPNRSLMSLA